MRLRYHPVGGHQIWAVLERSEMAVEEDSEHACHSCNNNTRRDDDIE